MMRDYAKIINGAIIYAPKKINRIIGGQEYTTFNPTGEMLEEQGWKPVVYTDEPETPEGYHYEATYSEENGVIVQGQILVQDEITEESALVSYANSLTGENDQTLIEAAETMCIKLSEED